MGYLQKKEEEMQRFQKRVPKKQRFLILSEHFDGGLSISELSRKYQITAATIYNWRTQMQKEGTKGHLDPKEMLEEIEGLKQENSRLKHTVAEQALDITTLKQWNGFIKKKLRQQELNSQDSSLQKSNPIPAKKGSVS